MVSLVRLECRLLTTDSLASNSDAVLLVFPLFDLDAKPPGVVAASLSPLILELNMNGKLESRLVIGWI